MRSLLVREYLKRMHLWGCLLVTWIKKSSCWWQAALEHKKPKLICPLSQHLFQDIKAYCIRYWKIKLALIIFILVFSDSFHLPTPVQFAMEKCILQQQRTAIEKQFIAFSCNIYTEFIFEAFSVVMREKMWIEWMKNFRPKISCFIEWENQFPSRLASVLCEFPLSTLLIRDVDLIRWKNIEKFSTKIFFLRKVIFHRWKCFIRPPKMNIWQIETGFSDN